MFDTWTRNCDRHPNDPTKRRPNRDNVFLSREGAPSGRFRLVAMDHGCCFTCGRDLTGHLAELKFVREEGAYGLFPEFWEFLDRDVFRRTLGTLGGVMESEVRAIVESIPSQWDVPGSARDALTEFLMRRAAFVAGDLEPRIWPRGEFDFGTPEEETP